MTIALSQICQNKHTQERNTTLALHGEQPEAARARLGELFALRDRLVAELRALREAVLRSGFNTAQEGVG